MEETLTSNNHNYSTRKHDRFLYEICKSYLALFNATKLFNLVVLI